MKASELLFLGAILSLPIQLNKFFWPQYSYVLGIPRDLLAPSIYLSDILIVFYIAAVFLECSFTKKLLGKLKGVYKSRKVFILAAAAFNFYLLANALFVSDRILLSFWFSLKVLEFLIFAIFASATLSAKKIFSASLVILAISVFWQAYLMFLQFALQRSLGLWFLGERAFSVDTPSIAHIYLFGKQLLRPYGTFPHPNVAAAFFVIAFVVLSSWEGLKGAKLKAFAMAISFLAALLSFSKAAAGSFFVSLIIIVRKPLLLGAVLFAALFAVLIFFRNVPEAQIASIAERIILSQAAFDLILKKPLFGVGTANFLHSVSTFNLFSITDVRLIAPVHNVFLLIFAEEGIFGLVLFLLLLYAVFKNINSRWQTALFFVVIIYLTVDHFFWTLQQGRFLFWLALAYILSSPKTSGA